MPTGMVFDLNKITVDSLIAILGQTMGNDEKNKAFSWLNQPLFKAWLTTAKQSPHYFCAKAIPSATFTSLFPHDNEDTNGLSARLHQEWSIISQCIWDNAFFSAKGGQTGNTATQLRNYAEQLVIANNSCANDDALSKDWGHFGTIFHHPLLARLRPPTDPDFLLRTQLSILCDAAPDKVPKYIRAVPVIPVKIPKKGDIPMLPINFTASPEVPSEDEQEAEQEAATTPTRAPREAEMSSPDNTPVNTRFQHVAIANTKARRSIFDMDHIPVKRDGGPTGASPSAKRACSSNDSVIELPNPAVFDPHPFRPAHVGDNTAGENTKWCLPYCQQGQRSLPDSNSKPSPALACAHRQALVAEAVGTLVPTSSESHNSYSYSRALLLSNAPTRDVVSKYSHWLSYRMHMPQDPDILTQVVPIKRFMDEYLFAPGTLDATVANLMRNAHTKGGNSGAVEALTNWLLEKAALANLDNVREVFNCNFAPAFFTKHTVQSIQNAAFKSGYKVMSDDEPTGIITPWHFIRSLQAYTTSTNCKPPQAGLSPRQLSDIIGNIIFLFHILTYDFRDIVHLGHGHSTFSRFSPLAGHLFLLQAKMMNRNMLDNWDSLGASARSDITGAVFVAIADLFDIYESWQEPKADLEATFLQASAGRLGDVIVLSPSIDSQNTRHLTSFRLWQDQVEVFSYHSLNRIIPTSGFFGRHIPNCFKPGQRESNPSNRQQQQGRQNQDRRQNDDRRNTDERRHQDTGGRNRDAREARDRQGESSRNSNRARSPLMSTAENDLRRPLELILEDINRGKPEADRLRPPLCQLTGAPRAKPICFRYCSSDGPGCNSRHCTFVHIDMHNPAWIRSNVPERFLRDFLAFLDKPEVSTHFRATAKLRSFLGATR